MNKLEKILFTLNTVFWLVVTAILFVVKAIYGLAGLLSVVLFVVLFFNASYFIISRLQKFIDSDWEVFKAKMKWANGWAAIVLFLLIVILESQNN
jgi:hypothetical protein